MIAYLLAAATVLNISLPGALPGAEPVLNCRYSLSPISAQHTAEGGLYRLRVTASHPQCPWTFTPASWVHVSATSAARGSMDLTYELLPNFFEQPRVAKLRLERKRTDGSPVPLATMIVRQQGRGQ